ncbi:MAG TPA: neutral zinc metallopeptidase [Acidimicrobiia bacterium]|nr:neutral zinc metallopeptidase [Acidimicrobiia bacterium]
MKWRRPTQQSDDVLDRRGQRRTGTIATGAVGLPVLLVLFLTLCTQGGGAGGIDLGPILDQLQPAPPAAEQTGTSVLDPTNNPEDELALFMGAVLDDSQAMWSELFSKSGRQYEDAQLVLFSGFTESGCGGASAEVGPHYCPLDKHVYLDLDFFQLLSSRFGAPGDFAQAYVLTHEVGHHVQTLLGINEQVRQAQQQNPNSANDLSVRMELQADCFAGVWGFTVLEQGDLERGDIEEAIGAAEAVGDDRIQAQANGTVNPETWTHGSAEQRTTWFDKGYRSGDPNSCDTFSGGI